MMNRVAIKRMKRELHLFAQGATAPGIAAWAREDASRLDLLDAEICGAPDTPYHSGVFRLEVNIPPEYPFKPPRVRFITKIYHPNIDSQGRICLDSLNMPPKGAWKPSLNIATLLTSIQALMSTPNADDGLMADITDEYRSNPALFRQKALQHTEKYAKPQKTQHSQPSNQTENQSDESAAQDANSLQTSEKEQPEPATSENNQQESKAQHDEIEPQPLSRRLKKQRIA